MGHTVTKLEPSLVPLVCNEKYCADMMGLSLKNVTLSLYDRGKKIYSELGEMLFTHFGVSGPLVLSASSHIDNMENNRYKLLIDLKPGLSERQLDARILRDFSENINRIFGNSLSKLFTCKACTDSGKVVGDTGEKSKSDNKGRTSGICKTSQSFSADGKSIPTNRGSDNYQRRYQYKRNQS